MDDRTSRCSCGREIYWITYTDKNGQQKSVPLDAAAPVWMRVHDPDGEPLHHLQGREPLQRQREAGVSDLQVTYSDDALDIGLWMATDGLRRCPMCGRMAKRDELGNLSGWWGDVHYTAYGHLPGTGCNQRADSGAVAP